MDELAVEARGLVVGYGSLPVLTGVDLVVPAGTATCVVGENGVGKSTLLRCVSGLQQPEAGELRVFGDEPGSGVDFWRRVVTTVEPPSWYPGLTAREHAEMIRRAHGLSAGDEVDELLAVLGIASHADAIPVSLSSGQKQRLVLAMALLRPSRLLVLDEPEQRLDPDARIVVAGLIREYLAGGGSALLASHDEKFAGDTGAQVTTVAALTRPDGARPDGARPDGARPDGAS